MMRRPPHAQSILAMVLLLLILAWQIASTAFFARASM
jgi:hypothetical protein